MNYIINVFVPVIILGLLFYDISQDTRENQVSLKEYGIALLVFSAFVFIFMYSTGVLHSEYHFVDDHEIYKIKASLLQSGLISTMISQVRADFSIRFRFTYQIVRVLQVWLMGTNLGLWHLMQSMAAILSMFCSYIFARKMRVSQWLACVFVVVIFIGRQSESLWRLGPQENLGMLLLMMTFLSLLYYLKNQKFLIICIILTFFLGGAKESFLLILPLLPIWMVIVECRDQENGQMNLRMCREIVRRRWLYFVSVFLIFIVDMAIIYFVVGTNQIGYAGIDTSFGIKEYIYAIAATCVREWCFGFYMNMNLIGIAGMILFLFLYIRKEKSVKKEWVTEFAVAVFMFAYILGSQLVLYAKSGMFDRYLLPATAGFAIFWIVDIGNLLKKIEYGAIFTYVFCSFLLMGCIVEYDVTEDAYQYAQDGKHTTALLEKTAEYIRSDPNILVALQAEELDVSTAVYLREKYDMEHVYDLHSMENNGALYDDSEAVQIYIGYVDSDKNNIENLMLEYGIAPEKYNSYVFGKYVLYAAKCIETANQE